MRYTNASVLLKASWDHVSNCIQFFRLWTVIVSKILRTTITYWHEQREKHIAIAKKLCHENGCSSASDPNISQTPMRRIVQQELGFYPYDIRRAYMLMEKIKVNRYEKARKLLSIVRVDHASNVLFTDEEILSTK
uniref:Tick transposon n=1 Tax=Heterorhabditis bacteriophora TaxID=37862 RepID=A0A1I7X5M7_HETBA